MDGVWRGGQQQSCGIVSATLRRLRETRRKAARDADKRAIQTLREEVVELKAEISWWWTWYLQEHAHFTGMAKGWRDHGSVNDICHLQFDGIQGATKTRWGSSSSSRNSSNSSTGLTASTIFSSDSIHSPCS